MIDQHRALQRERGEPQGLTSLLFVEQIAAIGWLVASGFAVADLRAMRLPRQTQGGVHGGTISIIVPARNEAHHIATWLDGARAQTYPVQSIIVADDCSGDGTAAAATAASRGDPRVIVRNFGEPPAGWIGKCWAAYHAAALATTDWLLFSDADMRLSSRALQVAMQAALALQADAVSLSATIDCPSLAERVVMPAIAAIIFSSLPASLINNDRFPTALLAGGFLLVRSAAYWRVGSHAAVRSSIAEDLALARRLKAFGYRIRLKNGSPLLGVRMYESFAQLWAGWRKNFYEGAARSPLRAAFFLLMSMSMLVLPLPLLALLIAQRMNRKLSRVQGRLLRAVSICCAGTLCVRVMRDRAIGYRTDIVSVLATPLAGIFVGAVMAASAWRILSRRGQVWKGRTIA